jgi:hypothetical protein
VNTSTGPTWTDRLLPPTARAWWLVVFFGLAVLSLAIGLLVGPPAADALLTACFAPLPVLLGPNNTWARWATIVALLAALIDLMTTPGSPLVIESNYLTAWVPVLLRVAAVVLGLIFTLSPSTSFDDTTATWTRFKTLAKKRPVQLPFIIGTIVILAMTVLAVALRLPLPGLEP